MSWMLKMLIWRKKRARMETGVGNWCRRLMLYSRKLDLDLDL